MNRARSELESSILELMEDSDARKEQLVTLEEQFKVEDEKIRADRKVHEDERDRLSAERQSLEDEAAGIETALPDAKLRVFRRIAAVRGGVALSLAAHGMCSACNVRLRPAMYQQVKRNERVITCDSCGRILFFSEEDAAPAAKAPAAAGEDAQPATPAVGQGE